MKKRCTKCGKVKRLEEFPKAKRYKYDRSSWCRTCKNTYLRMYAKRPEVRIKRRLSHRHWVTKNRQYYSLYQRAYHLATFIEALCYYTAKSGFNFVKCVHCGCSDIDLLTFDHVNNRGHLYRRNGQKYSGNDLARRLKACNWPANIKIQVLCFNCNRKKEIERRRQKLQYEYDHGLRSRENYMDALRRQELRRIAYPHYCLDGMIKCTHCGETDIDVLELDHISGRGKKQTPIEKFTGNDLIRYLRRNDWPVGLQVLCQNCNQQKHFDGK